MSPGERIIQRWQEHGTPFRSGASPSLLRGCEARIGVQLPRDLVEYLQLANGTCGTDPASICFWEATELKAMRELDAGATISLSEQQIVFADWFMSSTVFMACDVGGTCKVLGFNWDTYWLAGHSFEEFAERYADGSLRLGW